MKNKKQVVLFAFIAALSMMAHAFKVNAQQKDTGKVAIDSNKIDYSIKRYAIDGLIVTEKEFWDRKDGLVGLAAYPGIVFDPKFKGMVMMKISKANEQSAPVLKLKARAKELGLVTSRMERSN